MRNYFDRIFAGRQGMDELSKALFWTGIGSFVLSVLCSAFIAAWLSRIFSFFFLFLLILAFARAFSRNRAVRDVENYTFLSFRARQKREQEARRSRFRQRKDFRFYRCPGCKTMLRVPRGKGKIHIRCKCGYTLYRKT